MAIQVWPLRAEPTVVEGDNFRFTISGDYVPFGIEGTAMYATKGPLHDRHFVGTKKVLIDPKALDDNEWSASARVLPCWVEAELRGRDQPDFHCRIELRDNVPRVVDLGWHAREHQSEIRQMHLRSAEVSAIANTCYGMWAFELHEISREDAKALIPEIGNDQERVIRGLLQDLRTGRRHINAELLRQVANVYRSNFDHAPVEAVARTFGVKQRMAHKYVEHARDRGFLPPTTQGKKKA